MEEVVVLKIGDAIDGISRHPKNSDAYQNAKASFCTQLARIVTSTDNNSIHRKLGDEGTTLIKVADVLNNHFNKAELEEILKVKNLDGTPLYDLIPDENNRKLNRIVRRLKESAKTTKASAVKAAFMTRLQNPVDLDQMDKLSLEGVFSTLNNYFDQEQMREILGYQNSAGQTLLYLLRINGVASEVIGVRAFLSMLFLESSADFVARINANLGNPEELNKIVSALNYCSEITIQEVLKKENTFLKLKDNNIDLSQFKKVDRVAEMVEQNYLQAEIKTYNGSIVKAAKAHIEKYHTNINGKNIDGHTLLHKAVLYSRDIEFVRYLVEVHGADVTLRNLLGKTALDYAKDKDLRIPDEIIAYLEIKTNHAKSYITAAQKGDVESFKVALKNDAASLTQPGEVNLIKFINAKMRENDRYYNPVRFLLNIKYKRMLSATASRIKRMLSAQVQHGSKEPVSTELLSLLNQCPPNDIYNALTWYGDRDVRLVDKLTLEELAPFPEITLQFKKEAPYLPEPRPRNPAFSMRGSAVAIRVGLPRVGEPEAPAKKDDKGKGEAGALNVVQKQGTMTPVDGQLNRMRGLGARVGE